MQQNPPATTTSEPIGVEPATVPTNGVRQVELGGAAVVERGPFDRDRYLLHQKKISIDQKYTLFDEQGKPLLYVKRRSHVLRTLGAALAALVVMLALIVAAIAATTAVSSDTAQAVIAVAGIALALIGGIAVGVLIGPKRHIEICIDPQHANVAMTVLQDKKFVFINATYTAADADLNLLGWFHKNYLYNLFRKRWYVHGADGQLVCIAMEDSIWRSILRRVLKDYLPLMRTNFILVAPDFKTKLGEFNRKFTVFDKYVLDLTPDGERKLDRRMAVALGVLLDTGERR